ncbi:hypothetical protein MMJ63_25380, partial [Bacillus vallismortis]|nr:hypothetical protein [Bacillus vallismortis]
KGQFVAGFFVNGFYEDKGGFVLDLYFHNYSAKRSVKVLKAATC